LIGHECYIHNVSFLFALQIHSVSFLLYFIDARLCKTKKIITDTVV